MKLYLNVRLKGNIYNAGKAKYDANKILENNGYKPIFIGGTSNNYLIRQLELFYSIFALLWRLNRKDTLFLQIPVVLKIKPLLYRILVWKRINIEILIHDLDSYRSKKASVKLENYILSHSSKIIAHTDRMKNYLIERGIDKEKICVLYLFDYLTDFRNSYKTEFSNEIIFAGNLNKSLFLKDLHRCHGLHFLLYGLPLKELIEHNNVKYVGVFKPEEIDNLKGSWGLVWDGNDIETCSSELGEYLKINSSHKLSLYIAAEKPVIIWSQSSLKDFILDNNLGVVVNSLYEINEIIKNISVEQQERMKDSLSKFGYKLRKGEMLTTTIKTI